MKKSDNLRSHSWWWDSHISPKNSKWLQENLSEMDSKVNAMLKIIEADADSFAQRAELFYKKRPELVNLVEEFYRTYRALVERYTYLTREIRQNIGPALQAQLGVSTESAQNSPVDLHSKRGVDGPDIISPSYSYTGALEFDNDSPVSDVSAKGHTDDEFSPLAYRSNYERRAFGYKPRYPNVEETSHKTSESGLLHDVSISQLQKEIARLQDENKALTSKSTEGVTKLKSLELELSSFQSKVRGLEAEDKLTKKRLKAVQEKEQKLEAENLKLSHSLMSSKEEKSELLEQYSKVMDESKAAWQKIELLEDQMVAVKQDFVTAQSQLWDREEHLKKGEETICTLQQDMTTLEEERRKNLSLLESLEQQSEELHKKISDYEERITGFREESQTQAAQIKELQDKLTDVVDGTKVLEERLHASEQAKFTASLKVEELQKDLEGAQRAKQGFSVQMQQLAGDMARLTETICKLEDEGKSAREEKMEGGKYVLKLETDIKEGQMAVDALHARCQQAEGRCRALESDIAQSEQKLLSCSEEIFQHQERLTTFENMVASAESQNEELQKRVAALGVEKKSVMIELDQVLQRVKVAEGQCAQMQEAVQDKQEEIERLKQELFNQLADTKRLEESFSHVSEEKTVLVEREAENLLSHQQLENEQIQLKQQLELNFIHSENLTSKISSIEIEKSGLVFESQQLQQELLDLHEENTVLSSHCLDSKASLQATEAAARKAQEDLAMSVSEVAKLQEEARAKAELIRRLMSDVVTSETLLARSREESRVLGEDREKWAKELADYKAQVKGLETSLSESVTVNAALAEQVAERGKRIERLNHELQGSQEKVIAMNEDIALRTSHARGLQEEINSFREQVKLLHAELQETSEAKQSLEALVEGLQQNESEAKEANQTLVRERQNLLNNVLLLQNKNQDFESNLSHLTEERARLLEEAATHTKQCNGMKEKIMSLESDYEALQIQIGSLQDQLQKFEEKKQVMEEENKSFSKKLFEAEGRVQDLQLKLSNLLCEEAALAEQNSERISKIHILEAALFDLQKDNASLSEDVGLLQHQLSASKTREASLLAEMHDSSDLVQFLKAEIENLQQEVLKAEEKDRHFALEQKKNLDECLVMRQKVENLQRDLGLFGEENIFFTRESQAIEIADHSGPKNELDGEVRKLEAQNGTLQQELLLVQHMADQLQEELKGLLEERKQKSSILDSQKKKLEKQEEDLRSLQTVLNCTKEEQQSIMDKLKLLTEEKMALQQEMKESKHEAGRIRENFVKLETDFNQLQQMKGAAETKLGGMIEEVRRLQEDALILQTAKSELEQHLELSSRQVSAQAKEVGALQGMLAVVQQEKATLGSQLEGAERRIMEVSEECHQQKEGCKALTEELAAVLAIKQKLEQDFANEQEDKTECTRKLEKIQQDLSCLQDQKEQLVLNLEAASLQAQKNETRLSTLHVQLDSAESSKLELAEKQSIMILDWCASERMLLEEIENLKLASLVEKEKSSLQHDHMLRLEDEIGNLHTERKALQNVNGLGMNQIVNLQEQINGLKNELLEKQEETLKLSAQVNTLQKSLMSIEQENADLRELLRKDKECHGAAEKALKDELCLVQDEVISIHDSLSGLEKKNDILVEGMSLKERTNAELQKEAQRLREVKEELTQKLQDSDAQFVQAQANFKLLEAELHELYERHYKLRDENKLNETCYQAHAQEHTLFKAQVKELTGTLSNLQAENRMLKAEHVHEASALSHELLVLKEENGEVVKKAGLVEAQVITLQQLLVQAECNCESWKRQADFAAEKVSCLNTEIQDLLSNISDLNRQCQEEHEKVKDSVTNLNLVQQELAAARDENIKLGELVSDGERSARNLQEQVSSLNDSKQILEGALNQVTGQLKDSQMMLDHTGRSQQAALHELQAHSQLLFQIMSKIEDLNEMLDLNPANRQASIRHAAMGSQETFLENSKRQGGDLREPISTLDPANLLHLPEAIHDNALSTGRQQQPEDNCPQYKSPLSKEPMEIRNVNSSGFETVNVNQKSLFDAGVDAMDRLKEKIVILLKEDNSPEVQSVLALGKPKSSVEERQEELSHFQQQIEHLALELSLYKKDISYLKEIFEGNELQEEGEIANAEVKPLLHAWKDNFMKSEEKNRGRQEVVETAMMEKESVQFMFSDFQDKALTYAVLLRENLLLSGKGINLIVGEWDKRICSNGSTEHIDKLAKLEKSCTSSDLDGEDRPSAAHVLEQLQKRAEEVILLREAIEGMLPSTYYSKEGKESELSSTTGASKFIMPMDKHREKQRVWSFSTDLDKIDDELDMDVAGSIGNQTSDGGDEIVEAGSIGQAEEIDLIEGIARRLHIKLGMRLHQALMDEKLENELQELKDERKQLEEGLQTRVEQVQRMEVELERLQGILREGRDESGTLDPRQQQQWLQRKKRALKKARKLSKQLVQRRRQVGNMQDALATWVEQQELATKILEDQVLLLVDQEIAPTMEGWDVDQVNKLMAEMQSRKALTRRHSMDLHSVGQELQKVGSSIESTHRQLLRKEEQELGKGRISNETALVDASRTTENQKKLSRFGLTWFLLLFGTERKGLLKSSRSSTPSTALESSSQRTSRRARSSTAMRSLVAQTRKMGCCACGSSANALKSSDDK